MKLQTSILEHKVAIITGGGSGIGRAIATRFAREGADIVIAGRTLKNLEETKTKVKDIGVKCLAIRVDVSISADVAQIVRTTMNQFGKIDILVNNAGIIIRKSFLEHTEDDWNKVMDTNLKSVFLCCKYVVPEMLKQDKGKIINIASGAGLIGFKRIAYGSSKAGVINFTASLGLELAPHHINVNAICPGIIDTDMISALRATPDIERKVISSIPYGRLGRPDEIASAATFLASDNSDFMVGTYMIIDGGQITTFSGY